MSMWDWLNDRGQWWGRTGIVRRALEHLALAGGALALALVFGVLIGWAGRRSRYVGSFTLFVAAAAGAAFSWRLPTVRSWQVAMVLGLFAAAPIARATAAGFAGVDPSARASAERAGMTAWQTLARLEMPCARGRIAHGLRAAAVGLVGLVAVVPTLPTDERIGGLGRLVVDGARQSQAEQQAGVLLVIALGLVVWLATWLVERVATPRGLRRAERALRLVRADQI